MKTFFLGVSSKHVIKKIDSRVDKEFDFAFRPEGIIELARLNKVSFPGQDIIFDDNGGVKNNGNLTQNEKRQIAQENLGNKFFSLNFDTKGDPYLFTKLRDLELFKVDNPLPPKLILNKEGMRHLKDNQIHFPGSSYLFTESGSCISSICVLPDEVRDKIKQQNTMDQQFELLLKASGEPVLSVNQHGIKYLKKARVELPKSMVVKTNKDNYTDLNFFNVPHKLISKHLISAKGYKDLHIKMAPSEGRY